MIKLGVFLILLVFGCFYIAAFAPSHALADYSEYKQQKDLNTAYDLYQGAKEGTEYEYAKQYRSEHYSGGDSLIGQIIGWLISLTIFGTLGLLVVGMILQGLGVIKIEQEGSIQQNK